MVPTYGDLRFNPCWDDLRGDKRFDKIVAAAKRCQQIGSSPVLAAVPKASLLLDGFYWHRGRRRRCRNRRRIISPAIVCSTNGKIPPCR